MSSMPPLREQFGYRPNNNKVPLEQANWNQRLSSMAYMPQSYAPMQHHSNMQSESMSEPQSQYPPAHSLPHERHSAAGINMGNQRWHAPNHSMTRVPRFNNVTHYQSSNYSFGPTNWHPQMQQQTFQPQPQPQMQQVPQYGSYINSNWRHPGQTPFYSQLPSNSNQINPNGWANGYASNPNHYGFNPNQYYGNYSNMPNYMNGPPSGYLNSNNPMNEAVAGNWWNRLNAINNNYTTNWGNTPAPNFQGNPGPHWSNIALNSTTDNDANNANFSTSGRERLETRGISRTTLRPTLSRTSAARSVNRTTVGSSPPPNS